jgi:putative transposase
LNKKVWDHILFNNYKKEVNMVPNKIYTPVIAEILGELAEEGICDLSPTLQRLFNELMKIEREQTLQAASYERSESRKGYANGFKDKSLQTRFGKLELKVPQTRDIPFYPSCLEKGERSEKALRLAVAEMYINGVSTRRVKRITEELCGLDISSTQVSRLSKVLDEELEKFRNRPLGHIRFLYLDAHYEKVRHEGCVRSLAVLKAIGINKDGYKEILGLSCSLSEAEVHWRIFLESLFERGLKGVDLVCSDNHTGLKAALKAVAPSIPWQRCVFHLAQNAQSYAPCQALKGEIAQAVKEIYTALNRAEAEERMKDVIRRYEKKASRFCRWLEENFSEGLTFYSHSKSLWKKIRTVNIVERLNQEIRRRTSVARLFPNEDSCQRLITAVCMDMHEEWISGKRSIAFED